MIVCCLYVHTYTLQVPFGVTFDPSQMEFILNQAEAPVLLCDAESLNKILSVVPRCCSVKVVIVMSRKVDTPTKVGATENYVQPAMEPTTFTVIDGTPPPSFNASIHCVCVLCEPEWVLLCMLRLLKHSSPCC